MPERDLPDPLPDPEALSRIGARLAEIRALNPEMADAEIDEVLRFVPGRRAVLAGHWKGRAAVFRLAEGPETERQAREWQEHLRIWPQMSGGAYRVPEPLVHLPQAGLTVVERVSGQPLMEHLWQSPPEARMAILRPAACWLRRYTEGTESWRAGNAAGWLARVERAAAAQPFGRLRRLEAVVLAHLRRLAEALDGAEWRVAICHGDFHPNNLIIAEGRLTGIDTGASARLPVCKDIARFLVHMGRRGLIPSGRRHLGVDAAGMEIFAEVFDLTGTERRLWLPFFIGVEALIRVEHKGMKPGRIRRAGEMYAALGADLAGLEG